MGDDFSETRQLTEERSPERRKAVLAAFFTRHRARLRLMVELRLSPRIRGRLDPSDVLQEAFLEASERLEDYLRRPAVPLFVWLRGIAGQKLWDVHQLHLGARMRDARREVRLQGRAPPEASSEDIATRLVSEGLSPSETAMRAEKTEIVKRAIAEMHPLDRELLALRHFEQLTPSEVAQALGMKRSTASQRYFRALEKLRGMIRARGQA